MAVSLTESGVENEKSQRKVVLFAILVKKPVIYYFSQCFAKLAELPEDPGGVKLSKLLIKPGLLVNTGFIGMPACTGILRVLTVSQEAWRTGSGCCDTVWYPGMG